MQGEVYCCSARLKRTKAAYFCTASSFLAPSNTLIVSNWQQFCDEVTQSSVSLLLFPPEHLNTKAAPLPSPLLLPAHSHSAALSTCQPGTHTLCLFEVPGERWRQFYHYECFFRESVTHVASQQLWLLWRAWEESRAVVSLNDVKTLLMRKPDLTRATLFRPQKIHQAYAHTVIRNQLNIRKCSSTSLHFSENWYPPSCQIPSNVLRIISWFQNLPSRTD